MEINRALLKLSKLKNNDYIIFLFHGVIDKDNYKIRNYRKKHINKKKFVTFLKKCKKIGNPISIEDLVDYKNRKKKLPQKSFIISFDDGFENNYSIAIPILKKLNIPAVFYLSTDFVENNSMSWIDKVEYCFENYNYDLFLPWRLKSILLNNNKKKMKYLDEIRKIVKSDKKINLEKFVKNIFNQTGIKLINKLFTKIDKKLSWQQVKKINKSDLFTIGGHSHEHVSLGLLNKIEMKKQISKSFYLFKKKINLYPKHYSYPEGQKIDFNQNVQKILKEKKIIVCPTAINGINNLNTDLFLLRRILVN